MFFGKFCEVYVLGVKFCGELFGDGGFSDAWCACYEDDSVCHVLEYGVWNYICSVEKQGWLLLQTSRPNSGLQLELLSQTLRLWVVLRFFFLYPLYLKHVHRGWGSFSERNRWLAAHVRLYPPYLKRVHGVGFCLVFWWVCLFGCPCSGYVGWRVGVWLSDPEYVKGLRKLRPCVELHSPLRGEAERLGYGAETARPLGLGYDARLVRSAPGWKR